MAATPDPSPRLEEPLPTSDATMGRALRRTLLILLLVLAAVAGLSFLLERAAGPGVAPTAGGPSPADLRQLPPVRFTDITAAAGIRFAHTNGAAGEKLLPETMGGGVAFLDYDNDGHQDLLFVTSGYWPWHHPTNAPPARHALYHNDGQGRFTDVTAASGLETTSYIMGIAAADYDDDGRVDLLFTGVGRYHLFRNLGSGQFQEVTDAAGLHGDPEDWSTSAAWLDYDNDGDLDLFACHYLRWSRDIDFAADYQLPGIGRAYGQPWNFPAAFSRLFRNEGHGRFQDVSALAGIQVRNRATGLPLGKSLGVKPVDLDGDGWMDLVVANDTVQNFVFHNERNGSFQEIGAASGLAFDNFGGTRGAMGIDAARFREDDSLGISIGNFANEMTAMYVTRGNPLVFADEALNQGIGSVTRLSLTFGVLFFDYDLDGWLDLITANGHIETDIEKVQPAQRYRQPAQLFWNARGRRPDGGFLPVPPDITGPDLPRPIVGRGSAYADIDGDGDLDIVLAQINGPPLLLRNDQQTGHHWLRFKLIGAPGNRDALGASLRVRVGAQTVTRQLMPTRGYLSQSELPITVGLGTRSQVDDVTITWPNGTRQRVPQPRLDTLTVVTQER